MKAPRIPLRPLAGSVTPSAPFQVGCVTPCAPHGPQPSHGGRGTARPIAACALLFLFAGMLWPKPAQAQATLLWTNGFGSADQPATASGNYYNGLNFNTLVLLGEKDATINFNWGTNSPAPGHIGADNFSVEWTGRIVPPYSEDYTFYATSDDGCRVFLNGQLIIDAWVDEAAAQHASNPIPLAAGSVYSIEVDYYEHTGDASIVVQWESASLHRVFRNPFGGISYLPVLLTFQNAPDGKESYFGSALAAIGGGQVAVGAPKADPVLRYFPITGRATYTIDGGETLLYDAAGQSTAVLSGPRTGLSQNYGTALAGFGDGRFLVGAPGDQGTDTSGAYNNVGTVYLNGSTGQTLGTWPNPNGATDANAYFGYAVAALGGTRFAASSLDNSGSVFLYDTSQSNTPVIATIANPDPTPISGTPPRPWSWAFGAALAPLGTDRLLIGAPRDSKNGDTAGSVYIYDLAGNFITKVHSPTAKPDLFGSAAVAVDDHRFLVGAPNATLTYLSGGVQPATNSSAGLVYLFNDSGALLRTFTPPDISHSGNFGAALAMLGSGRVLIGSPNETNGAINAPGAVHLFDLQGVHLETVPNPAPNEGDNFGAAVVALDERHFVVGAPGADTIQRDAGSIYGFDAPPSTVDVGSEIPAPNGADFSSSTFALQGPTVTPAGAAYWHAQSQRLFAVKPGGMLVSWPLQNGQTYNWEGTVGWPTNNDRYQIQVAGPRPVDLSGGGVYKSAVLEATTTDADPLTVSSNRVFSAQTPGLSLLMLSSGDPASNAIRFQLVRTVAWNDPAYLYDHAPATVGQPIADPAGFFDPSAGSPQVVLSNAVYCPAPVFDPATRTGAIIPVNTDLPGRPGNDLVVAFYQRGTRLYDPATGLAVSNAIFWPYQPVRYEPQWPTNAPHLVIASQQGTGVIDPAQMVNWQLYFQNDPNQPGFNPNDEHALTMPYSGGQAVFALRSDLGTPQTSQPFVLVRYQDPASGGQWRMKVWQVVAQEAPWFFKYPATAGTLLQPPFPLSAMASTPETTGVSGPYWRDRKLSFWAKAAGNDGGSAEIVMHYFYTLQNDFFYPGTNPPAVGASVPLLDLEAGTPGTPIDVHFNVTWPDQVPELRVGETLVKPKFGLPDISSQTSAQIIYDQSAELENGPSAELIDPTREYDVPFDQLPSDLQTDSENGFDYFPALPPQLHDRFFYDPTSHLLKFKGEFIQPPAGEYYLLLNVLTARDKSILMSLSTDPAFQSAVNTLSETATNVIQVPPDSTGFDSLALTAGDAKGEGYVTLAFGNNTNLTPVAEPVSLSVIKVNCPLYQGELKVIESEDPFAEKLTLRHSGDFAGKADDYIFEWRTLPPVDGLPSTAPPDQWTQFTPTPASGQGAEDITIQGPGLFTLSDNYFICRYRPVSAPLCSSPANTLGWSDWTAPMLAEGWVKRVLAGINPFEQRFSSYGQNQVDTVVSMISQAGPPYEGPIALNQQNADSFGLIQAYETVLQRGMSLSINGAPPVNYGPANNALLLAAGRLSDLYMLLGNEAYADAEDPTIAIGTSDPTYGSMATSLFCFENQCSSLMEEELDLLRGRDDTLQPGTHTPPVYNRLYWNFTQGIDGGEVAYALNYNIRAQDGNVSGTISAADAAKLYPQGHGDAWGHYLSAIKDYYFLLRNTNFTWVPQIESVVVGGVPVSVGYEHERKFAAAAAALARTGAEIVNLTYRNAYVENPSGQWQGYTDSDTNRAWGLSEWGSRAGQGAFFNWVTANSLLPATDPNPSHTGIQKIDRTTVTELGEIAADFTDIQNKVDQADSGLNPLGLAKNVVPFDIDPSLVSQGKTHFEQIYGRALTALNNAITVFNRANNSTQQLRAQSDTVANFQKTVADQEADFNSRLIEIFGYPYGDDIGPTGSYPSGYDGPDIYHYDYVDASQLEGQTPPPTQTFTVTLSDTSVGADGQLVTSNHDVFFNIASDYLGFVKPASWTQPRRAPGQIQLARSDLLQEYAKFQQAIIDYNNLIAQIEDRATLLKQQYDTDSSEIEIMNQNLHTQESYNDMITAAHAIAYLCTGLANFAQSSADAVAEAMPKEVGLDNDVTAPLRGAVKAQASLETKVLNTAADIQNGVANYYQQAKDIASMQSQINITTVQTKQAEASALSELGVLARQEAASRLALLTQREALEQAVGKYQAALASGERLLEDRLRFRQETAAQVQQYRYQDMAFRIFRNDALQKYRAQFDLAAMYVYLAARAYDYETNLKPGDPRGPGSDFMTSIVRAQSLGLVQNGLPEVASGSGDPGLADPMAKMNLDWTLVLKGQLGFNNPQTETGRFSLRSELFRIQPGSAGSKIWRDTLSQNVVSNLLTMPEFKRFCIPFQPQQAVEPGIVIPFSTSINFGQNFFGWPLGPGDNTYDSTHFATKIRSVGVWFDNYNNVALVNTPHVYLIPVGEDVMRSPSGNVGDIRSWTILDQALPVPFPLSAATLNDPSYIPMDDSLSEQLGAIRQYPEFPAYTDSGTFDPSQVISNYRLVGRSVWNTRWLLIIPAGELLSDRNEALQRFIYGSLLPDGTRDGNGVSDIKIFFQTYAYSGN